MFYEYFQTRNVYDITRESVLHGRRRDGERATADDRLFPRDDQPPHCQSAANQQEHVEIVVNEDKPE